MKTAKHPTCFEDLYASAIDLSNEPLSTLFNFKNIIVLMEIDFPSGTKYLVVTTKQDFIISEAQAEKLLKGEVARETARPTC